MGFAQDLIAAGVFTEIHSRKRDADRTGPKCIVYTALWSGESGGDSFSGTSLDYEDIDVFAAQALEDMKEWIQTSRALAQQLINDAQTYEQKIKAFSAQ